MNSVNFILTNEDRRWFGVLKKDYKLQQILKAISDEADCTEELIEFIDASLISNPERIPFDGLDFKVLIDGEEYVYTICPAYTYFK